jgi:DNA-binding transcriptional regulator YiaG
MVTANQIKAARKKMQEKPGVFAKRFGVSRPTIIHWENGHPPTYPPTVRHVQQVLADMGFEFARRQQAAE